MQNYIGKRIRILFVMKGSALNRGMNTGIENLAWKLADFVYEIHILAGGSEPFQHRYHIPSNVTYHFTGGNGSPGEHTDYYFRLRNN